ncbi:MAG: bifunctional phosphoglucose/phosphomannose isomerase [Chitinophagales bacterium]|nr:bifunctional phosphoglucose/phosphomannose isomerase [Chitinophagales bacterium]
MKELIDRYPQQIREALEIAANYSFKTECRDFENVVICGLGGSGIGASFFKDATIKDIQIPVEVVKGYTLPNFVDSNSLVICSSYSGNTEETVACLEEAVNRNARVVGISSNGKVKELCLEHDLDFIEIPGGMPPRACFGYSTIQLFRVATYFNLIEDNYRQEFEGSAALIENFNAELDQSALALAEELADKIPVLYAADTIESIAIRWRQQINENGKQLCWHHVVPEMNHNELVGWRQKNEKLAVVFLRNEDDLKQVAKRMDLNAEVYKQYTPHIIEIWSKGKNFIETSSYLIQFGDYLSYHLSQLRGFDTTEVKVIDALKANLKNA